MKAKTLVRAKEKFAEENETDQIDTRIFNNHVNVFGSNNVPIFIVSITQINANLEEWSDGSEIPE